jgi:hypothetical protein
MLSDGDIIFLGNPFLDDAEVSALFLRRQSFDQHAQMSDRAVELKAVFMKRGKQYDPPQTYFRKQLTTSSSD